MKKVQSALVAQAYQAYLFGYEDSKQGKPKMFLREFCKRIKEVVKNP